MGELFAKSSPTSLLLSIQRSADDGAKLCVFGDNEANAEAVAKRLENVANGLDGGQVADEDDVTEIVATCCKNGKHCNRFGNEVGDAEGEVGIGSDIRDLAKVCGGEVLVNAVIGAVLRNVLDAQVHVVEVALGGELFNVLDGVYTDELAREPDQRSAANTRAAKILDLVSVTCALGVVDSSTRAHADNDGFLKPREVKTAHTAAGELGNGSAGQIVDRILYVNRARTRHHNAVNIREGKPVFGGEFAKRAVDRGQGIGRAYELRSDQLLFSVFLLAKAHNFGGGSAYVNANYGSVHSFQTVLSKLFWIYYNIYL